MKKKFPLVRTFANLYRMLYILWSYSSCVSCDCMCVENVFMLAIVCTCTIPSLSRWCVWNPSFFVFILKKWVIIKHKTFSLVFTIVWTKTDMLATRLQLLMWKIKENFILKKKINFQCRFLRKIIKKKKIRKLIEKLKWKFQSWKLWKILIINL